MLKNNEEMDESTVPTIFTFIKALVYNVMCDDNMHNTDYGWTSAAEKKIYKKKKKKKKKEKEKMEDKTR